MLGETLKKLRKEAKKSQSEIAKILSVSQAAYSKYECNLAEPDTSSLKTLADYYNVTVDFIMDRPEKLTTAKKKPPDEAGGLEDVSQALEKLGIKGDLEAQKDLLNKIVNLSDEQKHLILQMINNFKNNE